MENDEQKRDEVVESPEESNWVDQWNAATITGVVISILLVFVVFAPVISMVLSKSALHPIQQFGFITIIIALMGAALCLFIRSLRRGFNFWLGLLTIIGSFIMFFGLVFVVHSFFFFGVSLTSSQGFGRLMAILFVTLIGASLLTCGFKSKKG